jgi:hypothetical protein
VEPCHYCGTPTNHRHERFPKRIPNVKKFGRELIFDPINCVPACDACNAGHNNVDTLNEYEFIVEMVEAKKLTLIPLKIDRKAMMYLYDKECEGFLEIEKNIITYK